MTEPAELPSCTGIGIGDVYAVRSNHGAAPYLVACMADGQWACSCPAEHKKLRVGGRYCRPIREVIELRSHKPVGPLGCERKESAS